MSKSILIPVLFLGLVACADMNENVELDSVAGAEQALTFDRTAPISFPGQPTRFRKVDCPLINVAPSDWTALPASGIPGSPTTDDGYFPAVERFATGYSGTGLYLGALYLTKSCPPSDNTCPEAGFNVWSDGVSSGDCRNVNVRFRVAGKLHILYDELRVVLGRDHFSPVIELRFTSAKVASVRVGAGPWSDLGPVPSTDAYRYAILIDYFPYSHTATISADFAPPMVLSNVDFGTETGSSVNASYILAETSTQVSRTLVSSLQVHAFGVISY